LLALALQSSLFACLGPAISIVDGLADDASQNIEYGGNHEKFVVLYGRIILLSILIPLFVIVVAPKYQFFVFLELDERYSCIVQIVVIAVPKPLTPVLYVMLKKLQTDLMLKHDFANGGYAPDCVEDVACSDQKQSKTAVSGDCVNFLNKRIDNY